MKTWALTQVPFYEDISYNSWAEEGRKKQVPEEKHLSLCVGSQLESQACLQGSPGLVFLCSASYSCLGAKPDSSLKWEEYYVGERGQQEWVQILDKVRCRVPFPSVAEPCTENFFSYSSFKSRNPCFATERNITSEHEDLQVTSRKEYVSQSCMQTWVPCSQEWITELAIPDLLNLSWNHT